MKGLLKLKKKKKTNDLLFTHYFNKYQNPSGMYKKLHEAKGKKMNIKYIQSRKYQIKQKNTIKVLKNI